MLHIQVTLPGLILDGGGMVMSFGAHFLKIGAIHRCQFQLHVMIIFFARLKALDWVQ